MSSWKCLKDSADELSTYSYAKKLILIFHCVIEDELFIYCFIIRETLPLARFKVPKEETIIVSEECPCHMKEQNALYILYSIRKNALYIFLSDSLQTHSGTS